MRRIESIIRVEKRTKDNKTFYITTAICGGDECTAWSLDKHEFAVGDEVMVGFDDRYNRAKFWKELPKTVDKS